MRKITGLLCIIFSFCLIFSACSKGDSYAKRVKKERNAIKSFLNEHNIEVLKEYPASGVFKENQFFLDDNGIYINVVDSGNGKRANAANRPYVYYRFSDTFFLPATESDTFNLIDLSDQPLQFIYGVPSTYTSTNTTAPAIAYRFLSAGVTIPLKYVGEKAVVKLIIPFKSSVGSTFQTTSYSTLYYGKLEYTYIAN